MLYGTSAEQNINVRVGLPLGPLDGGSGGVHRRLERPHAGHRRRRLLGQPQRDAPVNAGYVGSGNDTGHTGGNCEPGVNPDGTYNLQFINDFIRNGMKAQVLLSKRIAAKYYAQAARPTTTGTAAPPAGARATCWRRSSAASSTASWPTHRRSTGRASRRRRCGARS